MSLSEIEMPKRKVLPQRRLFGGLNLLLKVAQTFSKVHIFNKCECCNKQHQIFPRKIIIIFPKLAHSQISNQRVRPKVNFVVVKIICSGTHASQFLFKHYSHLRQKFLIYAQGRMVKYAP